MSIRSFLTALGINAVPAAGWFLEDWTAGTTLALYWLETLLGTIFVAARILLHRRARPSKGHRDYQAPQTQSPQPRQRATYLSAFLVPAIGFTLTHGIFIAVLLAMMFRNNLSPEARIDPNALLVGLSGIALFQLIDFCFDLIWLKDRSFAWLERLGQQTLGRVFVIHFTIIGGMAAVMFTGANRHFFGVFIFLKTLFSFGSVFPQWQPEAPPAWLSNVMDRFRDPTNKKLKNLSFAQYWKQTDDEEVARVAHNEQSVAVRDSRA